MILPDANLLLYAVNSDSMDHQKALNWWQNTLASGAAIGLYTGVVFAFARLSTNRRVFAQPLTVEQAFAYIDNWLDFPSVSLVDAELEDLARIKQLLNEAGTSGNLVSDAQIAAAAIRLGGIVYSADHDFDRFTGLKWSNPLT